MINLFFHENLLCYKVNLKTEETGVLLSELIKEFRKHKVFISNK